MSNYNSRVRPFVKHTPSVLVMEGLGNQLFQFAMAHKVHELSRQQVSLLSPFQPWRTEDRPFALESLVRVCPHLTHGVDSKFRLSRGLQRLNLNLVNLFGFSMPGVRIRTFEKNLKILPEQLVSKITYTGFYIDQEFSSLVLDNVLDELRTVMPQSPFSSTINGHYGVIHIRRGDFDYDRFGRLDLSYFKRAMSNFQAAAKFFIVTDSPSEVSEFAESLGVSAILGPEELSTWETLELMSHAKYMIGSNSTLSWWGCLLSASSGGKTIMPNTWFRNELTPIWFPGDLNMSLIEASWQNIRF